MELKRTGSKELTITVSDNVMVRFDLGFDFATVLRKDVSGEWQVKTQFRTPDFTLNDLDDYLLKLQVRVEMDDAEMKKFETVEP